MQFNRAKSFLLFIISIAVFKTVVAQNNNPVRFTFSTERKNDSLVYLIVKAKVDTNFFLFSAKPQNTDDAFISQLNLDSNGAKFMLDTNVIQSSNIIFIKDDATKTTFHGFNDSARFFYPLKIGLNDSVIIKGSFAWLGKQADEFPSGEEKFELTDAPEKATISGVTLSQREPRSWLSFLSIGLIAGLITVFMPCLYPLFPVTVTYFMHHYGNRKQGTKNALFYSLCIILIYAIPATLLTLIFGNTTLYKISISPITNLFFFGMFFVFALSFFGLFEITLPSSWSTRTDKLGSKRGYFGIFFMALTLVIVSFSCTGIVAGQLLSFLSSKGVSAGPIAGMFGFGIGLALPFTLLALFPSLIHAMPKSGSWLNSVKVSFAFIELALALKFLSNVDLIFNWRLLDREVYIAIWIVLAALLGLYLLGKLKFYHDTDLKHITIMRLFFAIASFSFALYLFPGLWGAPLKAVSGWIPPEYTQDFNIIKYANAAAAPSSAGVQSAALPPKKFADKIAAPHGLTAYFDLDEGIAAARILNKPIMLDFTGYSCSNCRKMEAQVWSDPGVLQRIRDNFVLVSLYVDDPTALSDSEKYTNAQGQRIETVGDRNLDFQITKFDINSQPLYMFIDAEKNILSDVRYGYDANINKFISHLDKAKARFEATRKQ